MPKRPSNSIAQQPAKKAAGATRNTSVATEAACQTDNDVGAQLTSLRMLLLRLKSALIPPKEESIRHEDTEDQLAAFTDQMESAARLVPRAVKLLDRIELACCIPQRYKVKSFAMLQVVFDRVIKNGFSVGCF